MPEPQELPEGPVEVTTLLGKGAQFEGKLSFTGTVRVDGTLIGEISEGEILVVGPGGRVKADISVGTLIVEGEVEGKVRASQSVEIHPPGCVRGNIVTPSLFIDRGVVFEGTCQVKDVGE